MIEKPIKPKKQILIKFLLMCGLMFGYFGYLSYEYDILTGGVTALLTWSFFVLCTPVADAGFLLDFPLRLLFGIRMIISEMVVWVIAVTINILAIIYADSYYETTIVTKLLNQIINTPYPYWGVILLSAAGTFLSIKFGDELMDVIHQRDRKFFHSHQFKHELIMVIFFIIIIYGYYEMVSSLGIKI
jgi:hypothetical protein